MGLNFEVGDYVSPTTDGGVTVRDLIRKARGEGYAIVLVVRPDGLVAEIPISQELLDEPEFEKDSFLLRQYRSLVALKSPTNGH